MLPLGLIVGYSVPGRIIGDHGRIPWHEPDDMRHFRTVTTGHAIIMGRTTWESFGKPLPKRRNIVVSRTAGFTAVGADVFASIDAAIAAARTEDPEPYIIGGTQLYAQTLPYATHLWLTEIAIDVTGDTTFPAVDESLFSEVSRRTTGRLTFRELIRR